MNTDLFDVYSTLCVSTAHIPLDIALYMNDDPREQDNEAYANLSFDLTSFGYRVWVGCENPPTELKPIIQVAKQLGCRWIEFDRDAEKYKALPSWEW